jgi:hypothetical protein
MEKQYALIKEYPGSPKLGTVATHRENECYEDYVINDPYTQTFCLQTIENYPEFWEEVKSEYPKIIAFKGKSGMLVKLCDNGRYINKEDCGIIGEYTLHEMLYEGHCVKSKDLIIYQVQVESGEIFTIGDRVEYFKPNPNMSFAIDNFFVREKDEVILARSKDNIQVEFATTIVKVKTPIFMSEDGVEMFEGDKYYPVPLINGENYFAYTISTYHAVLTNTERDFVNFKYFSTEQAANNWIEDNKPMYSKKQIREALSCSPIDYLDIFMFVDSIKNKLRIWYLLLYQLFLLNQLNVLLNTRKEFVRLFGIQS